MMKRFSPFNLKVLTAVLSMLLGAACSSDNDVVDVAQPKSIVILYENDVHCAIDGYQKMAGLRDAINRSDTAYAAVVSVGDFLQGGNVGAISHGEYIADIMHNMGYAAITLGNHEFDYGIPNMKNLLKKVNAPVVCANYFDVGAEQPYYPSYVIKSFGSKRIAFVGAVTPETMILEGNAFYQHDEQFGDLRPDAFYELVQQAVDAAREEGADYVILLSHVGETTQSMGFDSHRLIAATTGIDMVLDGHSHSVVSHEEVANKEGVLVGITQTGTQFAHVGKLLITKDGHMSTSLIPTMEIPYESALVAATSDSVKALLETVSLLKVGSVDYDMPIVEENGYYTVRCGECRLGDAVTDALLYGMPADFALLNGGGIRNALKAGDITFGDVVNVLPYDNALMKIEASGAQILEVLQKSTATSPIPNGDFPQCSGIRYTIHTASHTVSDIQVLDTTTGEYVDLDLKKLYTVTISDYCKETGFSGVLKDCPVLETSPYYMYHFFADYITNALGGVIDARYAELQGRITIIND